MTASYETGDCSLRYLEFESGGQRLVLESARLSRCRISRGQDEKDQKGQHGEMFCLVSLKLNHTTCYTLIHIEH